MTSQPSTTPSPAPAVPALSAYRVTLTHKDLAGPLVMDLLSTTSTAACRRAAASAVHMYRHPDLMDVTTTAEQLTCAWFAGCDRVAARFVDHPVLGDVPACQRCADRARS